jgi:hypothetical protein
MFPQMNAGRHLPIAFAIHNLEGRGDPALSLFTCLQTLNGSFRVKTDINQLDGLLDIPLRRMHSQSGNRQAIGIFDLRNRHHAHNELQQALQLHSSNKRVTFAFCGFA